MSKLKIYYDETDKTLYEKGGILVGEIWKSYFKPGNVLHRINGPALILIENPSFEEWFIDGVRHRKDGPAVNFPHFKCWYYSGKKHRNDGPAVIRKSIGDKEWWFHGVAAKNEEQFYNKDWRRTIELHLFL